MIHELLSTRGHDLTRRHERSPVRWPVHLRVGRSRFGPATVRDLSSAGFFIQLDEDVVVPVGTRVGLRLFFPDRTFLDLSATVRWSGYSHRHQCTGSGVELDIVAARGAHPWAA